MTLTLTDYETEWKNWTRTLEQDLLSQEPEAEKSVLLHHWLKCLKLWAGAVGVLALGTDNKLDKIPAVPLPVLRNWHDLTWKYMLLVRQHFQVTQPVVADYRAWSAKGLALLLAVFRQHICQELQPYLAWTPEQLNAQYQNIWNWYKYTKSPAFQMNWAEEWLAAGLHPTTSCSLTAERNPSFTDPPPALVASAIPPTSVTLPLTSSVALPPSSAHASATPPSSAPASIIPPASATHTETCSVETRSTQRVGFPEDCSVNRAMPLAKVRSVTKSARTSSLPVSLLTPHPNKTALLPLSNINLPHFVLMSDKDSLVPLLKRDSFTQSVLQQGLTLLLETFRRRLKMNPQDPALKPWTDTLKRVFTHLVHKAYEQQPKGIPVSSYTLLLGLATVSALAKRELITSFTVAVKFACDTLQLNPQEPLYEQIWQENSQLV